jgi:hypothetical protein
MAAILALASLLKVAAIGGLLIFLVKFVLFGVTGGIILNSISPMLWMVIIIFAAIWFLRKK